MNIQTILDKFETEYCNNHNRKIRWLRGAFIDQEDQILTIEQFLKDSLTSMLDEIIEYGPQRMEHEEGETEEMKNIVSEHNGCVYDFHKIINSHR